MKLLIGGFLFCAITYIGVLSDRPDQVKTFFIPKKVEKKELTKNIKKSNTKGSEKTVDRLEEMDYEYDILVHSTNTMMFPY